MIELTARELLLSLFGAALDAVDGEYRVTQWCQQNKQAFTHCVAIGKAAPSMLRGALNSCSSLQQSLLICPPAQISRSLRKNAAVTCIASSHPVPDERSLLAGQALLQFLRQLPAQARLLFLISGGSSALVEVLDENISLAQCSEINRYLLASGKPIRQINAWRARYSKIKAGGLLDYIETAYCTQLLLSDVRDDDVAVIGSGLLVKSHADVDDDAFLQAFFTSGSVVNASVVNADAKTCTQASEVNTFIIGNLSQAMAACVSAAEAQGLDCIVHDRLLEGESVEVAQRIAQYLRAAPPGVHVWGGETTVTLPDNPGIGGRNQSFALSLARQLSGTAIHVLAAGTDGVDGNTDCAGAAVSAYTVERATAMGMDVDDALRKANAGMVLMATDDLIRTGPTGTNVMDLVIAYVPE